MYLLPTHPYIQLTDGLSKNPFEKEGITHTDATARVAVYTMDVQRRVALRGQTICLRKHIKYCCSDLITWRLVFTLRIKLDLSCFLKLLYRFFV